MEETLCLVNVRGSRAQNLESGVVGADEEQKNCGRGGGGGGGGRRGCLAEESEDVKEEREEVEENEEEGEERSEDFLSGTGGFGFPSALDFFLCREEAGGKGKEVEQEEEKGHGGNVGKAPMPGVRGEEGLRGEDTGVPGVGVLDWLE